MYLKQIFSKYTKYYPIAFFILTFEELRDIVKDVMSKANSSPLRGEGEKKLKKLENGIEVVKSKIDLHIKNKDQEKELISAVQEYDEFIEIQDPPLKGRGSNENLNLKKAELDLKDQSHKNEKYSNEIVQKDCDILGKEGKFFPLLPPKGGQGGEAETVITQTDIINQSITNNSNNVNNFGFSNYDVFINPQQFIEGLSLSQKGAVFHMSICITMLFCLFTLISVFYGEYFIIKFNLEVKYPKLSRFIKIRRKFQHSYFFWNSVLIIFCILFIFSINLFIFIAVS